MRPPLPGKKLTTPGGSAISSTSSVEEGRFVAGTLLGGRYRIIGLLGRGGMEMADVHSILEAQGKSGALAAGLDRSIVEAAALYMGDEDGAFGFAVRVADLHAE